MNPLHCPGHFTPALEEAYARGATAAVIVESTRGLPGMP